MRDKKQVRRLVAAAVALASTMAVTSTSRATPPSGDAIDAPRAAPDRATCVAAHHDAQELRKAGKLLDAGKKLLVCASETCPGPIVTDCVTWAGQLEEATPSLVLEIEVDGRAPTEAKVSVDNVAMKDWSHAIVVDPGAHVVKVEVPSFPPYVEKVVMAEGHRRRLLSVKLETPGRAQLRRAPTARPMVVRLRSRLAPCPSSRIRCWGLASRALSGSPSSPRWARRSKRISNTGVPRHRGVARRATWGR